MTRNKPPSQPRRAIIPTPHWVQHVEAGHAIIGLWPMVDGKCSCSLPVCAAPGKHPRDSSWQDAQQLEPEQAEEALETGLYAHGYGVLLGDELLVVDVDARSGGLDSLAKLSDALGIELDLAAGYLVTTGSGGGSRHLYFTRPQRSKLRQSLSAYPGLDFKSTGYVVGAGSQHASGSCYEVQSGDPYSLDEAPQALLDLLAAPSSAPVVVEIHGGTHRVSADTVKSALSVLDPDLSYERWVGVGMALHSAFSGSQDGLDIWDGWSSQGPKYKGLSELSYKWASFGRHPRPVTAGSIFHWALAAGWHAPAGALGEPEPPSISFDEFDEVDSQIDLARPPGFVGEVVDWIDSQCMFPRENLCVLTALVTMGAVVGLRYIDDYTRATGNLFGFGIAASSSGKEAPLQAARALLRAAGLAPAVHGGIKSTQEITRNLMRHRAAIYVMDELGSKLGKITAAGAATPYLMDTIGELMEVYSKADGIYTIGGDAKEAFREQLEKAIAKLERRQDEGKEIDEDELAALQETLSTIDLGISRPFLALLGFSTPSTFERIVSYEQADAGFLGRALLVIEKESNPYPRDRYRKPELPESIAWTLQRLAWGGAFNDTQDRRITGLQERHEITSTPQALAELDLTRDWVFRSLAEDYKASGLEAVARRAFEQIVKISFILAAPDGVRGVNHVRWARAFARRDVQTKARAVYQRESSSNDAFLMRVESQLTERPLSLPALANTRHLRGVERALVAAALAKLVEAGRAIESERPDRRKPSRVITEWRSPS